MTGTVDTPTADLIAAYGRRVVADLATSHTVVSPLGIWLLLALLGPGADDQRRARLETVLGTSVGDAASRAAAMLRTPHPAVQAALAAWARKTLVSEDFLTFLAQLPADVETGEMPSAAEADAWASDKTHGLITKFPIEIDARTAIVLASALATDVSWDEPFDEATGPDLGGELGAPVTRTLRAPESHLQALVATRAAGVVGVHAAHAAAGLVVVSVLAAAGHPAGVVHDAAAEVAAMVGADRLDEHRVDPFDLEVGEGAAWTISERDRVVHDFSVDPRRRTYTTLLPSWRALGDHDLVNAPGVADALAVMESYVRPQADPPGSEARQSAIAEYSRHGFKAAAVTAFGVRATAIAEERVIREREVTIRFNRPYAVVALADGRAYEDGVWRDLDRPAWSGVPVFNAWVAEARDAESAGPG